MSLISLKRVASSPMSRSAGTSCIVVMGSQRGPAVLESIFNRDDSVCHYVAGGTAYSQVFKSPSQHERACASQCRATRTCLGL